MGVPSLNDLAVDGTLNTTNQPTDFQKIHFCIPGRVVLVVSVSAFHTAGRGFASRPGHTKDHYKDSTNCLLAWHAMR